MDRASRNLNVRALCRGELIGIPASKAAFVAAPCGVEPVIAGDQGDIPACDVDGQPFDTLIAFLNIDLTSDDLHSVVPMDAVIAGSDAQRASCDTQISVGMMCIRDRLAELWPRRSRQREPGGNGVRFRGFCQHKGNQSLCQPDRKRRQLFH